MRFCKKYTLLFFSLLIFPLLYYCGGDKDPRSKIETRTWEAMGTQISISLCSDDKNRQAALFDEISSRIIHLETILSSHMADSELNKLNNLPVNQKMEISNELWEAVDAGKTWNIKTLGTFDITAGPLIKMWKAAGKNRLLPSDMEIKRGLKNMGVDKIVLEGSGTNLLKKAEVSIDLGGLGKGYTADNIITLIKGHGETSALVAMSGDIRALGHRPDGKPWRVGIQDPRFPENPDSLVTVVELADMAVSTSGNYRRYVEINGSHYSHIVDPRTGLTAENVPSVSVIGPDTLTTDIMGTALSVLGVNEGTKLVESMKGIEAIFMEVDNAGELMLTRSSGYGKFETYNDTGN
ncbi:MAG: FAD:protein FMN transferase [Desulfatiglans sp.]|jgi:thiamine biosynthesis lipoprotein|nr:FAD:protein FMN transferase [Desulfatiglans sp.]